MLKMNTIFNCPIGTCDHSIKRDHEQITDHIKLYHPQALIQLNLYKYAFYCETCDTYTNYNHYHCNLCEHISKSLYSAKKHKILHKKKWYLEEICFKGQDCLDDKCKYNHYEYSENYIIVMNSIPMSLCEFETPWVEKEFRCNNMYCNKDHLKNNPFEE